VVGCFSRYADATLAEVLGISKLGFPLVRRGNNGTVEPRDCENWCGPASCVAVTPLVRVPTNLPPIILRYMDTGAHGLHVPWVKLGRRGEAVVRSVKYHPRGIRDWPASARPTTGRDRR